ncbi:urease accessory protein UreF [Rhizobium rhizosphaerae]|uniref:Urease accessory protein UreF n=1 Tax=Xaviernesmea rhizosphaerae TaxID=1672749 RepID=A0ABX3P7H3_9HYPH|nr:urease accessory protein UreF [Xaviernesmea rhizosphaerae]OQP83731.1 urease accessory protein UreF [Xaviernesmea rhizosphaerae]
MDEGARPSAGATTALLRLMTWMSPAFPVGAFSYSGGLEQAIASGAPGTAEELFDWLSALLTRGSLWNDAVLLAEAHRSVGDPAALAEVAELAEALAGGRERHQETLLQGSAFLTAAQAWPEVSLPALPAETAYPVAVGAVSGAHGVERVAAIAAYLQGSLANQTSVAIRCGLIGQVQAVALLARLEHQVEEIADRAAESSLETLGTATLAADIAVMAHETLPSRLFRS